MAGAAIPANCVPTNNALLQESGRIGPELYYKSALKRPIIGLVGEHRGAWMDGMGASYSVATFERSLPTTTTDDWTNVANSDGDSTDACLPPTEIVDFGETTRAVNRKHKAIETKDFCIEDIRTDWQFAKLLSRINAVLAERVSWEWAKRYTLDYFGAAGHKLVLNKTAGVVDGSSYNTSSLPTAAVSQGVLEDIYMNLVREGSMEPIGYGSNDGAPVFPIILSAEASRNLIRNNPDIRQDIRFAWEGQGEKSPLLTSLGMNRRAYGGWIHFIDPYPRRFVFSGGAYVEVPVWVAASTTKGNSNNINPAWKAAPYEEFIPYHPECYRDLAVNNISNPAAGWKFDPVNYMGDFRWVNEYHRTCNPDRTKGYFRAVLMNGAEPINPDVGYIGLAARCGNPTDLRDCYGYTS